MIADQSIHEFCRNLASRTPSPGGGATAAVVGAIGAAQLLMVAEYAEWPEADADPREGLHQAAECLLRLASEDAEAYAAFRAAPKGDPAARAHISQVPRDTVAAAQTALALVDDVAERVPQWFQVDVAIARSCLDICAAGARLLIEANS